MASSRCRICLDHSQTKLQSRYHSLEAKFPDYLNTSDTVLHVLTRVTSSPVYLLPDWPHEICTACLKTLKVSYDFIQEFNKTQSVLENRQQHTETKKNSKEQSENDEEIINVIITASEDPLQIESEWSGKAVSTQKNTQKESLTQITVAEDMKFQQNVSDDERDADLMYTEDVEEHVSEINISDYESLTNDYLPARPDDSTKAKSIQIVNLRRNVNASKSSCKRTAFFKSTSEKIKLNGQPFKIIVNRPTKVIDQAKIEPSSAKAQENPVEVKVYKKYPETTAVTVSLKTGKYSCKSCSNKFTTEKALMEHMSYAHPETKKEYICGTCFKEYTTERGIKEHSIVHTDEYKEKLLDLLRCKECGHQCPTKQAFHVHREKHSGKQHKCDDCDYVADRLGLLTEHKKRVHGPGVPHRYVCYMCGKMFKYNNALRFHLISIHKTGKKFLCRFCGHESYSISNLKRHERLHTDERPYQCQYCNKTFRGASERNAHHMIHEDRNLVSCPQCGKGFRSKWNLKMHRLKYEGNYKCTICTKTCVDEGMLKFHYFHKHKIRDEVTTDGKVDDFFSMVVKDEESHSE